MTPPPPTTSESADLLVQAVVDRWYGSSETGGAVVAVGLANGEVIAASIGDAAPGDPATPGDTMRVGSITKTFMSALTLRLHDLGALNIDDPVARYLPELPIPDAVTIRSLLAHTSGINDADQAALVATIRADPAHRFEFEDLTDLAVFPNPDTAEGGQFAYANAGYHVLGGVIEAATNAPITEALRTEVLERADLSDTFLAGDEAVPAAIVPGNVDLDGDGIEDSLHNLPYLAVESAAWTAGALVSTPYDVIQFARALFGGSLVSDEALGWMTDSSAEAHGHGLGLFDIGLDGATVFGHSGGGPGFHANFAHNPQLCTTAVVFTNCPSCPARGNDTWDVLVDLLAIAEPAG